MGAEIEIASDTGLKYAASILTEIHKSGFKIHGGNNISDGIKRPSLYVTKHTNMPCVLIEPFFCDSSADVKLYNPNTLGSAIAAGIINIIGGNSSEPVIMKATIVKKVVKVDYCLAFQKFYNEITKTSAPLTLDGYGANTQKALDTMQKLVKGVY